MGVSKWLLLNKKFKILQCSSSPIIIQAVCGAGAQTCDCKHDRLWVWFPLKVMKYLIDSFPRIGKEAKRGIEFRYALPPEFGG